MFLFVLRMLKHPVSASRGLVTNPAGNTYVAGLSCKTAGKSNHTATNNYFWPQRTDLREALQNNSSDNLFRELERQSH